MEMNRSVLYDCAMRNLSRLSVLTLEQRGDPILIPSQATGLLQAQVGSTGLKLA